MMPTELARRLAFNNVLRFSKDPNRRIAEIDQALATWVARIMAGIIETHETSPRTDEAARRQRDG